MSATQKHLSRTLKIEDIGLSFGNLQHIRPRIVCRDGFSISVQAGEYMYSAPRQNGLPAYFEVECGYPSARPPETWAEYFDGEWYPDTIWGRVARLWNARRMIKYCLLNKKFTPKLSDRVREARRYLHLRDCSTTSVYAYVPIVLVDGLIDLHGGLDETATYLG